MKNFVVLFLILNLTCSSLYAQRLKRDFSCNGKNKKGEQFEVSINDIAFAKEVMVKMASTLCSFKIETATYTERSIAPRMVFDLEINPTCKGAKGFKFLKNGFIRVDLGNNKKEVHAHILIGHDPILCTLKEYNSKKLKTFIQSSFK